MTSRLPRIAAAGIALLLFTASVATGSERVTLEGVVHVRIHRDQVTAILLETPDGTVPLVLDHTARRLAMHDGETVRLTGTWQSRRGTRRFAVESFSVISPTLLRRNAVSDKLLHLKPHPPDGSGFF